MTRSMTDLRTLRGFVSAVPTPFCRGRIDEDAFAAFCDWQIREGAAGLVVCGTTGEAPTLLDWELRRLVRLAVSVAAGRVPVIAGIGANSTERATYLAQALEAAFADGLLVVTPYYNRPPQEGLLAHFTKVHHAARVPIILYDVPARTGCQLAVETVARLAELPRVVGIKDASGDVARARRLRACLGDGFRMYSGDDATVLDFLAAAGDGCVSVLSNVAPAMCARLQALWDADCPEEARAAFRLLLPLARALARESNPIPVKHALSLMGKMSDEVRLPLCRAAPETRALVAAALADHHGTTPRLPYDDPAIFRSDDLAVLFGAYV